MRPRTLLQPVNAKNGTTRGKRFLADSVLCYHHKIEWGVARSSFDGQWRQVRRKRRARSRPSGATKIRIVNRKRMPAAQQIVRQDNEGAFPQFVGSGLEAQAKEENVRM